MDPFKKLAVRIKGTPRTYTIIHHILLTEFTPRELAVLERVCKSWQKEINSDTELWWNKWMKYVWGQKNITGSSTPTATPVTTTTGPSPAFLKDLLNLQNSLSLTDIHSSQLNDLPIDDNSSYCSTATTLTDLSAFDTNTLSSTAISGNLKGISVASLNTSKKISRAERKRGPKVWKKLAIEEYRKQEVRNVFKSVDLDPETDDSDDTIINTQERTASGRRKLTSEEKMQARSVYKMNRSKPKSKNSWKNSSNVSKEWSAFENYYTE